MAETAITKIRSVGGVASGGGLGDNGLNLVLTMEEVAPVMTKLTAGGIEVTALHNHLLRNQPFTMYTCMCRGMAIR
jgi:Domain of Unknown Function (DUF1259)